MSSQQRSLADPRRDEYRILHEADLRDYLAGLSSVAARLGGAPASWSISEVGDGNLNLAFPGNYALCKITEDLIFTDPYRDAEQNRWTQPWLDATAAAFREDLDLHAAISRLKLKFMAAPEALIHGDLHTGSIMVTDSSTMVIDPEFAFYGPMGFDLGAVIGNLLMSYLASAGHERSPGERGLFEVWVLETIENVWTEFAGEFLELWRPEAR